MTARFSVSPVQAGPLWVDLCLQHLPDWSRLMALYPLQDLDRWRHDLQHGARINQSEQRAALHLALRAPPGAGFWLEGQSVLPDVHRVLDQVRDWSAQIRAGQLHGATGKPIRQVVHLGIGGSGLGPKLVLEALKPGLDEPVRVQVVSGVDRTELDEALSGLDAGETLLILASKSLTTDETLRHVQHALHWVAGQLGITVEQARAHHVLTVTASPLRAQALGMPPERILRLWDWVGGRFSLWSAMGLPIAVALGFEAFLQLLQGARQLDEHFLQTPPEGNAPVLMALASLYHVQHSAVVAQSVVAYSHRLRSLPAYLQQLEMESNGKQYRQDGSRLPQAGVPILFGGVGPDVQHSYFQMLHQGPWRIASDLIVLAQTPQAGRDDNAAHLFSQALAQAVSLSQGNADQQPHGHRHCPGQQPVSLLVLPQLTALHLGALLALYEHKVYVQGRCLGINSFDQWGVEWGKAVARHLESMPPPHDTVPTAALDWVMAWHQRLQRPQGVPS